MNEAIKPCPFRAVNNDGQILCQLIKGNDREITLDLCRACPVSQINCQHLRASLEKQDAASVTVRFVTGRTEVWNNNPPAVAIKRAACAEKAMPIESPRDCVGCPIRLPQTVPQGVLHAAREYVQSKTVAANALTAAPIQPQTTPQQLVQTTAQVQVPNAAKKPKPRVTEKPIAQPLASATPSASGNFQSKIIKLEQWLSGQRQKKKGREIEDPDVVRDIPTRQVSHTASVQPMAEEIEKCVGWTD